MAAAQIDTVIRHLRRAVLREHGAGRTDGQLLAAFIDQKDEAAFEALVRRHGSMVFGVCRRVVGNHHDAEDAFQATFLVLARKASSVRPRGMVANWLHGVACRTAMKSKTTTTKRRVRETNVTKMPEPEAAPQDQWHDLQPVIDQELSGLPENYRLPIILCDLEGKSIKEATQQLGWPQGTLAGRLARARKLLAKRLTQRGVVLSGGALAVVLAEKAASACVRVPLVVSTTKAAVAIAAGQAAALSLVSAKVAALMEGVMKSMMLTKLKTVAVGFLALCVVASGGGLVEHQRAIGQQSNAQKEDANPKDGNADVSNPGNKADSSKSLDEEKLHGAWITYELGNFSLIFGPGNTVRRIAETDLLRQDDTGTYSVDWSKNPHHLDLNLKLNVKLPARQAIMEFAEPGILRIEMGSGEARPKDFTDQAIVLTRVEKHPPGSKEAKQDAEREMNAAEFYQRTGKFSTAYFHYRLVQIHYPGTSFAEKAKQGLEDLNKHRTRLVDGSEVWGGPGQPMQDPPPPLIQEAPKQPPLPPPPPMYEEAPNAIQRVHVQMMLVRVPAGFAEDFGLRNDKKRVLTPTEVSKLNTAIRRLKSEGHVDVLTRPELMTIDNQPATVQIGNAQSGVTATITPRVLPDGAILLRVEAQLNETSGQVTTSQSYETTESLRDGGTLVIRALVSKDIAGDTEVLTVLTANLVAAARPQKEGSNTGTVASQPGAPPEGNRGADKSSKKTREAEADSLAATVNGEAILAKEVYAAAYLSVPDAHNLTALDRFRRIATDYRKTLDRVIEREVIVQAAFTAINKIGNGKVAKELQEVAAKQFGRQWVETVKKSTGLKDDKELKAFLCAQGTSMDAVQRQWERDFIAEEYLRNRLFWARDPEHAREERARIISELKQRAVIEYAEAANQREDGPGATPRPVKVGHIIIVGNTKTKDAAILKEIPLRPGDAIDYEVLRTAKKNLGALKATIDLIESVDNAEYKDIRVTVVEK
jgi:RNA polymerase sigma factor (sigma-70 family)